jgi:integrase/recombinase XerD
MTSQTTPLRQRMIDDMKVRNMSALTRGAYVRAVKTFAVFHGRSPDKLNFEDVRTYQLHLISRGLQPQTLNQIICALRFFYAVDQGSGSRGPSCTRAVLRWAPACPIWTAPPGAVD